MMKSTILRIRESGLVKDGAALVAFVLFGTVVLFWSATLSGIVSALRAGGLQ